MPEKLVTRTFKGREFTAEYTVEKRIVTVTSEFGHKQTQLGSLPAELLAGTMLAEILTEAALEGRIGS